MSDNLSIDLEAIIIGAQVTTAVINVAGELMDESTPRTPNKDGELRGKRRVEPKPYGADMRWRARHAGAQNAGKAGKRIFKKYTTAGTGKGFADFDPVKVVARIAEKLA